MHSIEKLNIDLNIKLEEDVFLADLNPGEEATIAGVRNNTSGEDRIRDLGLIDGTQLRVIKFAPLGDPMEVKVRGFYLSIRKSMARQIRVKRKFRGGDLEIR